MKKTLLIPIVIAAIAIWWFLPSKDNDHSGPVETNLPDHVDTIILISIDTLRADHLSCYGYKYQTTPNIDQLAQESLFVQDAFSTIPLTLPAHSSMLSGLIPPTHGVHDNIDMRLPVTIETLPEILKENGYRTYGIVSTVVLNHVFGLSQGFDVYDDVFIQENKAATIAERNGKETTEHALKWLSENQDQKKFIFIHYYDPHDPYAPPSPYDDQFEHPYDGEIAFVDNCIGQIIHKLKSLDLYEDALIIITGDHGEMLGEHGEAMHSYFVYQSAIRVPLILKLPNNAYVTKIRGPCSIIDIAPTVLAIASIDIPGTMQGVNLVDLTPPTQEHPTDRAIYSESLTPTKYNGNSLLSVVSGEWHYIQTTRPELYHRFDDPLENNNLITERPRIAGVLQEELAMLLETTAQNNDNAAMQMSSEDVRVLESLGYVGGAVTQEFSFDQSKPDPKDLLPIHNDLFSVGHLLHEKDFQEAMAICKGIIKTNPDIPEAYQKLSDTYGALGQYDKEVRELKTLLKLSPNHFSAIRQLALACDHAGDLRQAIKHTNSALTLSPDDSALIDYLANLYTRQGDHAKAIPLFVKRLKDSPNDVATLSNLTYAYYQTKEYSLAIKPCERLFELQPANGSVCSNLARLYMEEGSYRKAIAYYKKHLILSPYNTNALKGLSDAYRAVYDHEQAIETLKIIADLEPQNAMVYDRLADVYIEQKAYRASEALKIRLGQTPKDVGILHELVSVYATLKEYQLCIDLLKQLLEIMPADIETNYRLAKSYHDLNQYPEAVQSCLRTLELAPQHLNAHLCLSQTYLKMNRLQEAIAQFESVLKIEPNLHSTHNTIAWIQATYKDPALFNPESALVHAQRAADLTLDEHTGKYTDSRVLDTLAAAQAANEQFDAAVETMQNAARVASAAGQDKLIREFQDRLQLYQNRQPYLEEPESLQDAQP